MFYRAPIKTRVAVRFAAYFNSQQQCDIDFMRANEEITKQCKVRKVVIVGGGWAGLAGSTDSESTSSLLLCI
jgi:NADPH-dependent 2,4-dienoyl-CoA reductase/sulfur reductase-like enzyme